MGSCAGQDGCRGGTREDAEASGTDLVHLGRGLGSGIPPRIPRPRETYRQVLYQTFKHAPGRTNRANGVATDACDVDRCGCFP